MAGLWACACGRKVPSSIAVCRCGKPRPEPGETLGGGADALARLPPPEPGVSWSWLPKVLGVLVLVGLYFGSRMLNKHNASKEARGAAVQALSQVVDAKAARAAVGQHHDACFEAYYKTGWGRRQSSKFETEKYARCILDKSMGQIEKDVSAARLAAAQAERDARAAQRQQRAAAAAVPAPTPTPEQRASWGKVSLGDLKVAEFKREPQLTFKVDFVALGNALTPGALCSFTVSCETRSVRPPLVVSCPLKVEGVKGSGTLHYAEAGPAPAGVACTLELQISDGVASSSNKVSVALR